MPKNLKWHNITWLQELPGIRGRHRLCMGQGKRILMEDIRLQGYEVIYRLQGRKTKKNWMN